MKVSIRTSYGGSGKPLAALNQLLKKRLSFAQESARDSAAAIAAECFRSIRAMTRRFRGRKVKVTNA